MGGEGPSTCGLCCHGAECRRGRLLIGLEGQILLELRGRHRHRVCTARLEVGGCGIVVEVGMAYLPA